MKTVKRKANVGERILFTKVDIGKVDWVDDEVMCVSVGNKAQILTHTEYEVIIENETEANKMGIIEQMQAEINELKSKVAELEGSKVSIREAGERTFRAIIENVEKSTFKSSQQIRDEIIAKAKSDVEALVYEIGGCAISQTAKFYVNHSKRAVTALIYRDYDGFLRDKGIAKADPSDCFNSHIGKAISLRRALGLVVPAEYYNVPEPTEVRGGDVLKLTTSAHGTEYRRKVSRVYADVVEYENDGYDSLPHVQSNGKIIDDSRE